jgi:hypothetical protein
MLLDFRLTYSSSLPLFARNVSSKTQKVLGYLLMSWIGIA